MYFNSHFTDGRPEGGLNQRKQQKVELKWLLSGTREKPTQGEGLICRNLKPGKHSIQRNSGINADILWKTLPHS